MRSISIQPGQANLVRKNPSTTQLVSRPQFGQKSFHSPRGAKSVGLATSLMAIPLMMMGLLGCNPNKPAAASAQEGTAQTAPAQPGPKVDFSNAQQLRGLANHKNPKAAAYLAENLGKVTDPALRKELTQTLLHYNEKHAQALHNGLRLLSEKSDKLDDLVEDLQASQKEIQASIETIEKVPSLTPEQKTKLAELKAGLAKNIKDTEKYMPQLEEANEQMGKLQETYGAINDVTVNAIKFGLATFEKDTPFQLEEMRKLQDDPRGKVRSVAAFYLRNIQDDKAKAELIVYAADAERTAGFYGPGSSFDVPQNMVGSYAVKATETIQDKDLRIATLTTLSKNPISTVKNAVTAQIAGITEDHARYKEAIIGVSSAIIPGHFNMLNQMLGTWPKPLVKELAQELITQGLDKPQDATGMNYSRSLGVRLMGHLPESENDFKLNFIKKALSDRHEDVRFSATVVGFPFQDKAYSNDLLHFFLKLDDKAVPNSVIFRSHAVANLGQGSLPEAEVKSLLDSAVKDENPWMRVAVLGGSQGLAKAELRSDYFRQLLKDSDPQVKARAVGSLKLSGFSQEELKTVLDAAVKDKEPFVRYMVLSGIHALTDTELRDGYLNQLAKDPVGEIAMTAQKILSSLKKSQ